MNYKLFFQIILGILGMISLLRASVEPDNGGIIFGVIGIVLIGLCLALIL